MNVCNGLLLSSLWDAAFDAGLVTFDDEGRMIVSPLMDDKAAIALGIEHAPRLPLNDDHRDRLAIHRKNKWLSECTN